MPDRSDQDAEFTAFVAARGSALYRTAWMLTRDGDHAEDLLQSVLTACYPRWAQLAGGDPEAYVRVALARTSISWRRRRWHAERATASLPDVATTADPHAAVDVRGALFAALGSLSPRQRAVLVLRYVDDLSEADVATALGIGRGTVKSTASRALASLRERADLHDLAPRSRGTT